VDGTASIDARPFPGIDNGYRTGYRVRFDEAGPDGQARISTLFRYAQDVAWRHSEDLGFDRGWYQARNMGWVVRAVELELHSAIPMGEPLQLSTAVIGHKRIWARRRGEFHLSSGSLAARVTTDWVLLDGRNRIVRIPDDFGVVFPNPAIEGEILRVPAPEGVPMASLTLGVRPRDIDPLDHVNNAVYVDWLDEALEDAGWPSGSADRAETWRLEYLASAERGDTVSVDLYGDPETWRAEVKRLDGLPLLRAQGRAG
jgi:acyl-ACP thioesterase